jgi:hypothetical protein
MKFLSVNENFFELYFGAVLWLLDGFLIWFCFLVEEE